MLFKNGSKLVHLKHQPVWSMQPSTLPRSINENINLHNRFEVFHHIHTNEIVDTHCISEQNTDCGRDIVSRSTMGVESQLGVHLDLGLDGKSKTVGKKTKIGFSLGIVLIPRLPVLLIMYVGIHVL